MRCDLNVSVASSESKDKFGARVEVKNLNSIKQIMQAAEYEIDRHVALLSSGQGVPQVSELALTEYEPLQNTNPPTHSHRRFQETRTFDPVSCSTIKLRSKETAPEYKFMPEPDLPVLDLSKIPNFSIAEILRKTPLLPEVVAADLVSRYGIEKTSANKISHDPPAVEFFERACDHAEGNFDLVANFLINDLFSCIKNYSCSREITQGASLVVEEIPPTVANSHVTGAQLGTIVKLVKNGKITSKMAKKLLKVLYVECPRNADVMDVVADRNMVVMNGGDELIEIVEQIVQKNSKQGKQWKVAVAYGDERSSGKILKYFVGHVMKATKGNADIHSVNAALREVLGRSDLDIRNL